MSDTRVIRIRTTDHDRIEEVRRLMEQQTGERYSTADAVAILLARVEVQKCLTAQVAQTI